MTNTTRLAHGIHHAGLTVPDMEKARAFFIEILGFELVGGRPEYPAEPLGAGPTRHMMFYMPGGIRLELIAPPDS
jgi:catechol 2,3-dioxygenase-like lactoylglutathione lyase family enzyme